MALEPGTRLGPYEILSAIGAGGMGEVYRAQDSKLGRDVAIKTLPPLFARNADSLARFRTEARALASLNHPNIAAIYGLEESGSDECLILELVEGETLAELIRRTGPLPVSQMLDYALQIAEAVEAAHSKGIIHRDLKPANVKVTPEGRVKVLDFGLAKAIWGSEDAPEHSQLATATLSATLAGHIVGTPGYMSPEQAQGKQVDARSDIFSFGSVLYEMVTGRRAFQGETTLATLSAILEKEPTLASAILPKTPPALERLIASCLQKDAERRIQRMSEVRLTLEDLKEESRSGKLRASVRPRSKAWAVAAVLLLVLGVAAATMAWLRGPSKPADRSTWVQLTNLPDAVSQPALSPDGHMVVFVRGPDTFAGPGQIYVKILPVGEPVQLTRDNLQKMSPVFSPDASKVAYTTVPAQDHWDTWIVPVLGGQPQPWLPNASGLVWLERGKLLFSEIKNGDIQMGIVAAEESRAGERDIYIPAGVLGMAHRCYPSPDAHWALVVEMDRAIWLPCRVVAMDGRSAGRQVGPPGAGCTFGAWSPDGKWVYLSSNAGGAFHIWRQRFPNGQPEQITSGPTEEEGIAMAADGHSFVTAVGLRQSSIWVHDPSGERQVSLEGYSFDPKFTPDGKRLCYRILKGSLPVSDPSEMRVLDLNSGRSEALLPGFSVTGRWGVAYDVSPDGQEVVAAVVDKQGRQRLWVAPIDRRLPPRQIPNVEGQRPVFGPGGEIFFRSIEGTTTHICGIHQDGTGLRRVAEEKLGGYPISISPDGHWLLARNGGEGPVVVAYPVRGGSTVPILGHKSGILDPILRWSSDGRLFLISVPTSALGTSGRTYVVPLPRQQWLSQIPSGGIQSEEEIASLPGTHRIEAFQVVSPSPEIYAFVRETAQRNLYRIPLP
jgi:serine/threonine protein kinase/Tol biopolymer transport system component